MNIIVEGIDKAGKTTITGDIREALFPKIPVVLKLSRKPQDGSFFEQNMVRIIYTELLNEVSNPLNDDHVFLFDRSFPSEMVYSIKRGYSAMEDEGMWDLDRKLGSDGKTLLIYCEADVETIAKRFETEKEEYLKRDDIEKLLTRYEYYLAKTSLPVLRINSLTDRGINLAAVRDFLKV